jgi:tetratricopeptide (TPR) repeat protein
MNIKGVTTFEQVKELYERANSKNAKEINLECLENNVTIKEIIRLAAPYIINRDFVKAEEYFQKALEINPSSLFALLEYGTLYAYQEKYEMAIEKWKDVLTIDNNCVYAYYNIANTYFRLGKMDIALKNIEEALNIDISNKLLFDVFDQMYASFKLLYDKSKNSNINLLEQALAFALNDKFQEALNLLTILIFFEPENDLAYYNRGLVYHINEKYDEAFSDLKTTLSLNTHFSSYNLQLEIDLIKTKGSLMKMAGSSFINSQHFKEKERMLEAMKNSLLLV